MSKRKTIVTVQPRESYEDEQDKLVGEILNACAGHDLSTLLPAICGALLEVYTQIAKNPSKEEFMREVGASYDRFMEAPVILDS
jgi:hypothetical protein